MALLDLQGLELDSSENPGDEGTPQGGDSDLSVGCHGHSGLSVILCEFGDAE